MVYDIDYLILISLTLFSRVCAGILATRSFKCSRYFIICLVNKLHFITMLNILNKIPIAGIKRKQVVTKFPSEENIMIRNVRHIKP